MTTTPLKWAGGKKWIAPIVEPLWQALSKERPRRWVELFSGGMSLAFHFRPQNALLNDKNPHVINFFTWLQKGLRVEAFPKYEEKSFYKARERFNELLTLNLHQSQEAAALFYYLNRTGFNGLCRFNKKGLFNVPYGRHKSLLLIKDFSEHAKITSNWVFINDDFSNSPLKKDDLIYLDPPYDDSFQNYHSNSFDWDEQKRLADWASQLTQPLLISNLATPRILKLYKEYGFSSQLIKAPRRISANGGRAPATEVLAYRNLGRHAHILTRIIQKNANMAP